ncbi:enoyl-CoA hydratase-related protein [Streptomyces sp. NBC_01020]|uniref:enoyl-CoA hydratase-related protein n=1 Tax=unclassified Streptomyces TaxID=2593676 RepID=UPI002E1C9203|nr:enoyl-CoA hydratase-related protein [Streptomyces sp. NBC_01020]WSX65468.1 enoyl-CoA hydratase-related protein [Streptomyces sp. NBC_00932]
MGPTVLYEVEGAVATVTINRPQRRNAVSMRVFEELRVALERAAGDAAVRALVLTGAGDDFCVGADLTGAPESRVLTGEGREADEQRLVQVAGAVRLLREWDKPSVAVIRGGCAGAGMSLALACDLRYAADDAVFNTAFLTVGLTGDLGIGWLLTQAVGPARARELMLLPEKLTCSQALSVGLVTAAVAADELAGAAGSVAERLAAAAPLAVAGVRRNLDDALRLPLDGYLPREARRIAHAAYSEDAKEARAAFLEKRAPVFTGQ